MSFTIDIEGDTTLVDPAKAAFEARVADLTAKLVYDLSKFDGITFTTAAVNTDTDINPDATDISAVGNYG